MITRLAVLVLLAASTAGAAPVAAPHVQVELLADVASVQPGPGRDASVGVRFVLEDGWHVYWRNPGDSGEAPRATWTVPAGFSVSAFEWPAPTRIPIGPLANFGYEGSVLLPAVLSVPDDAGGATSVDVRAQASWLVCDAEECIPGAASLALVLPVRAGPPAAAAAAPLFAAARAQVPGPPPPAWRITAAATDDTLTLDVRGDVRPSAPPLFFPVGPSVIEPAAPQQVTALGDGFRLAVRRWAQATAPLERVDGVLSLGERAYAIAVPVDGATPPVEPLALAFAGGLLLNLMPCVFPVLALKAFGLVQLAGEGRRKARRHGLVYAAGVLVSFLALAGLLLALRAGGASLGWGFQLQSPVVVAALACLFFWMALTLLGVCTVGGALMGVGSRFASAGGWRGAFASGVLATVVATPCTAPFMGTALGYALVQPPAVALAVFAALAAGFALPYVALTFVPALGRRLPRPGPWMQTLEQLLAFPLLATVVWLTWVASLQGGPDAVLAILSALLLLGVAAWLAGRWPTGWPRALAAAFVVAAVWVGAGIETVPRGASASTTWEPYTAARVEALVRQGKPVFVDFTAAWCVTCQVNERLALDTAAVRAKMGQLGVVPVRADWTQPDPEIARALRGFGREGVPLYVLYTGRAGDPPRILPQVLTTDIVITELERLEKGSPT